MTNEQAAPSIDDRLRAALEATSDYVFLLDRDLRVDFVNRRTEELNGVEPHHYEGLLLWEAWPSSGAEPVRRTVEEARQTGRTVRLLHNHGADGGLDRWLEIDVSPMPDGVAVIFRDITQRWLEQDLLRATAESVQGMVAYLDKDLVYRFCNGRYEKLFGVPVERIVGTFIGDFVGPETFARANPHLQRALGGEVVRYESWMTYPQAGRRYMRGTSSPRKGPDGRVKGIFAQVLDDIERRLAEELRREQDEKLRQNQESLSLTMKAGKMG
ncbi:PAS domain S-box protein [bacterium]|nr:MAG: PAS domain S-box protein [bacterium]